MVTPDDHLLQVASQVSDRLSEEASGDSISEWDTVESPSGDADRDETLLALKQIARVGGAYRALARSGRREPGSITRRPLGRWGRLELMEKLGEGAAAEVFRAHDTRLDHDVALKLFKRTRLTGTETQTILEEGRRHARVKHPNIAAIHDADQHDGRLGISMEYIKGSTLHERVARHGHHGAGEAAHVGVEVCRAVAAIHQQGLVHGDIKAQNVMREEGGRIVVMDFSTSRPLEAPREARLALTEGTPIYMAPELFEGAAPSPQTDVYALGVLLFYLATGTYPVKARNLDELKEKVLGGQRTSLYDLRPDLPPGFVQTVERALSDDPQARFPSAGALGGALAQADQLSSGIPADLGPETSSTTPSPPTTEAVVLQVLAGLAGTVLLVGLMGFVSSMALNVTLGRPAAFAGESVADWLVWGVRSLIPCAVYMALAGVALLLLVGLGRALKAAGPVGRAIDRLGAPLGRLLRALHLDDPVIQAQALFAVGLVALAAVAWQYSDLIGAFITPLDEAHESDLDPLRPGEIKRHAIYGITLDLLVLALVVAWIKVFRRWRRERAGAGVMPLLATVALVAAALFLWATPYRILFQNEFEKVELGGQRGYVIGEQEGQLLLYLPDAPRFERRVFVEEADSRVRRLQVPENIFSP